LLIFQKKSQAIEDSSFGSSAIFPKRPAAFRPHFTASLALSGFLYIFPLILKAIPLP
jgi:hypothetical protein